MTKLRVSSLPDGRLTELLALHQHLHRHPELAFEEFRTTRTLAGRLNKLGLNATQRTPKQREYLYGALLAEHESQCSYTTGD